MNGNFDFYTKKINKRQKTKYFINFEKNFTIFVE